MILSAKNLTKSYRNVKVLSNFEGEWHAGKIYGILGPNGAGKSTLFKILCGLVTPDEGSVEIYSTKKKPIGAIIETPALYDYLNSYQNIKVYAAVQDFAISKTQIEEYLQLVGLPLDRKDPVRNFSMGMKQRLGIAIALLNEPDILIFDEPFSGLDPIGVNVLSNLFKKLAAKGLAVVVSSHLLEELAKSCNYLFTLNRGVLINKGKTQHLLNAIVKEYTLTGTNLKQSISLQNNLIKQEGERMLIHSNPDQIGQILENIFKEGRQITSCVPSIKMEHLLSYNNI